MITNRTALRRPLRLFAAFAAVALMATACGDGGGSTSANGDGGNGDERGTVVVGSANFDENEIVANMYAAVLEEAGYTVETRFLLGSREIYFPALEDGEIDLIPEYLGSAVEYLNSGAGEATGDPQESAELLQGHLEELGLEVLEPADAANQNGLVVTRETAEEHDLATVSDLEPVAGELVLGGPPECPERPLCLIGYEEVYGLDFEEFQPLDAGGPVTIGALQNGDIDVALLFTTDDAIVSNDWVLLEDDEGLQPAENLVPVIRTEVLNEEIRTLLNEVSAALTTAELTELNRRVRQEGEDPADVARDFLEENGLL